MKMEFLILAIGIGLAGYCIGEGLRNFGNPRDKGLMHILDPDDDEHELMRESEVHAFMGIPKGDAEALIRERKDMPRVMINGKAYYQKAKLREWLKHL